MTSGMSDHHDLAHAGALRSLPVQPRRSQDLAGRSKTVMQGRPRPRIRAPPRSWSRRRRSPPERSGRRPRSLPGGIRRTPPRRIGRRRRLPARARSATASAGLVRARNRTEVSASVLPNRTSNASQPAASGDAGVRCDQLTAIRTRPGRPAHASSSASRLTRTCSGTANSSANAHPPGHIARFLAEVPTPTCQCCCDTAETRKHIGRLTCNFRSDVHLRPSMPTCMLTSYRRSGHKGYRG